MAVVGVLDLVRVRGRQPVQSMSIAMRPRDDPEASVVAVRVDQIVHQEELVRRVRVADRLVPEDAVLVPEEGRGDLRRLADDVAAVKLRTRIPEVAQDFEGRG